MSFLIMSDMKQKAELCVPSKLLGDHDTRGEEQESLLSQCQILDQALAQQVMYHCASGDVYRYKAQ